MSRAPGAIRTPDQRLRVFVSSTLRELAEERRAVRRAIERLALAPVMFELGARPHPPRSLYRAYLEQSDIFVGIYAESYGWVAPGEAVSGLEDEYVSAPDVPMLIYIKRTEQREPRLDALLDRVRDDERVSYVAFDDSEELAMLVTEDLATLLAERFDDARRDGRRAPELLADPQASELLAPPAPLTRLIGRDREVGRCIDMLTREGCRLVTVTGPGGIGKSRLALAVAREVRESFPDGVAFVDLAPIRDPTLVIPSIATALGIRDVGSGSMRSRVAHALSDRRVLLVLDNVEQVVEAARDLSALLDSTLVAMLATSRVLLRIEGERVVSLATLSTTDAVELFVERAQAVAADFALTDENAEDIAAVTTALDNLPLAVELAAARVRVLPPALMTQRLDRALPLLVGGARSHPARQRTLRAAIEWSAELLDARARDLLFRLSVFRGAFGLDAVEWIGDGVYDAGSTELLEALVDSSLVQSRASGSRVSFTMLATVREYALGELSRIGARERCEERHAAFFSDLAARAEAPLIGPSQVVWIERLRDEFEDLRAAIEHCLRIGRADLAAAIIWPLYWFWWASGRLNEVFGWIAEMDRAPYALDARTRRVVTFYRLSSGIWLHPDPTRLPEFEELLQDFREDPDQLGELFIRTSIAVLHLLQVPPGVDAADRSLMRAQEIAEERGSDFLRAIALLLRGQTAVVRGSLPEAVELFAASLAAAERSGDVLGQSAGLYHLGWVRILSGDGAAARGFFVRHLLISSAVAHEEGVALGLESMFAVAAMEGDLRRAGRFLGAAEDIRARRGMTASIFSYHQRMLTTIEASPEADALAVGRREGREAPIDTVVEEALA